MSGICFLFPAVYHLTMLHNQINDQQKANPSFSLYLASFLYSSSNKSYMTRYAVPTSKRNKIELPSLILQKLHDRKNFSTFCTVWIR